MYKANDMQNDYFLAYIEFQLIKEMPLEQIKLEAKKAINNDNFLLYHLIMEYLNNKERNNS